MWWLHKAKIKSFYAQFFFSCLIINVITSIVTDYACTDDDWSVIETIKSEPHKERYLVSIDDAYMKSTTY